MITKTLESTPRNATHWSTRSMAKETGLSTAVSRIQGNQPAGDTLYHLRLIDGLMQAGQLVGYQGIDTNVADRFLLNDKPFNPNPLEAPPARRFNVMV